MASHCASSLGRLTAAAASPSSSSTARRQSPRRAGFSRVRAAAAAAAAETPPLPDFFAADKRPIILFDGVCNLCNGGVNLALDLDPSGRLRFAALQSPAGRALLQRAGRQPDDISSIVLIEENKAYVKSDAVLRIATYLDAPLLPPLLPLAGGVIGPLFPQFFRDAVYDLVADNRYDLLGKQDSCRLGDDRFDERFVE
eukprot:CAMPEP_0197575664 /NCGR_PEP_ID=MMETSP1326-20131121/988_1 /TAXON_ID=1155430 /ORGANISM="Genus nov. species nov., Strain RCC2288" /LENGTH=197 /DNA_ID=CAMNT_0043138473 /DNA_START=253 /DNA_END=846 /DNA_ORIENTATION=+